MFKIFPLFSRRVSSIILCAAWILLTFVNIPHRIGLSRHVSFGVALLLEFVLGAAIVLVMTMFLHSNYVLASKRMGITGDDIKDLKIAFYSFAISSIVQLFARVLALLFTPGIGAGISPDSFFGLILMAAASLGGIFFALPYNVVSIGAIAYYIYAEQRIYKTTPLAPPSGAASETIAQVEVTASVPSTKETPKRNRALGVLYIFLSVIMLPLFFFAPMAMDDAHGPISMVLRLILALGLMATPPFFFMLGISYLTIPPARIGAAVSVPQKEDIPKKNWVPAILYIIISVCALSFSFSTANTALAVFCFILVTPFFFILGVSYLRTPPVRISKPNAEMPKDNND
jgi:hypothetical protein